MNTEVEFKNYNQQELLNIENYLIGKKLAYKVKNKKILKKRGNTTGKTLYQINDETRDLLKELKTLTIHQFVQLYNKELDYCGNQNLYSKIIRNKMVFNYLMTKQIITAKAFSRLDKKTGEKTRYTRYYIINNKSKQLLNFYTIYLSSKKINNLNTLKEKFKKNDKMLEEIKRAKSRSVNKLLNINSNRVKKIKKKPLGSIYDNIYKRTENKDILPMLSRFVLKNK